MLTPPPFKESIGYAFYMRDYKGETIKLLLFCMTDFWFTEQYPKLPSYFWAKFAIIRSYHNVVNCIARFSWPFEISLWQPLLEDFFCSTQKMHIFKYVCKICLKELRILLKCRETFEKFLPTCNSSKNNGRPHFF